MSRLTRLVYTIVNRWIPLPDLDTIDKTGIVYSDYPEPGNGWIKGWVVNTPNRDIVIVCNHAGPSLISPHNAIFVKDKFGKKIERTIVAVDRKPYKLDGKRVATDYTVGGEQNYYLGGDIAICKVDKPFPREVHAYDFATGENNIYKKAATINQLGKFTVAHIFFGDSFAWIRGKKRWGDKLKPGDSGLPWFIQEDGEWRVVTHTTKGMWGEGPHYGGIIYKDILQRISNL